MATTTDELLADFREDVSDPLEGIDAAHPDSSNLWSNAVIYRYMTDACDRVARDTKGLVKLLTVAYTVGQSLIPLPRHVLHIQNVRMASNNRELKQFNIDDTSAMAISDYGIRANSFDQMFASNGEPRVYVRDYDQRGIRIAPAPQRVDSLIMQCSIVPAVPMSAGMMLPFLERPDQHLILTYMKYLAYRKQDADTYDLKRSSEFKAEYDATVVDREQEFRNIRRAPGVVRPQL